MLTVVYIGQSNGCFCFSTPAGRSHVNKWKNLSAQSEVFGHSMSKTQGRITIVFLSPRDSECSNLSSLSSPPSFSSKSTFVSQKSFFMGLPTTACQKKTKKHFDSETAWNVLIICFLQRCKKKQQTKKDLGSALVFLDSAKITRERSIGKNVGKLKKNVFVLQSDTSFSFFFFSSSFYLWDFNFPHEAIFFTKLENLLNFRYVSFMQKDKESSRKRFFLIQQNFEYYNQNMKKSESFYAVQTKNYYYWIQFCRKIRFLFVL